MKKKILVIGASGMVASRFVDLSSDKFEITPSDEKTLDITNNEAIKKYFENNKFDAVINFAAYTNVDGAETERGNQDGIVYKLNTLAPKYLADVCNEKDMFLVHISTDFIFLGTEDNPGPYPEDAKIPDELNEKIGWYGWTKNRGEAEVVSSNAKYAVVRYGYPFRAAQYEAKNDWARNLIKLYKEDKLYPLFSDQIQNIIFIDDLSDALQKVIADEITGILHIASSNTTTPFEAGKYLLEKYAGKEVSVEEGSMVEFLKAPGRTPRPRLGGLVSERTQELLGMKFKTWKEMVDEFVLQLGS